MLTIEEILVMFALILSLIAAFGTLLVYLELRKTDRCLSGIARRLGVVEAQPLVVGLEKVIGNPGWQAAIGSFMLKAIEDSKKWQEWLLQIIKGKLLLDFNSAYAGKQELLGFQKQLQELAQRLTTLSATISYLDEAQGEKAVRVLTEKLKAIEQALNKLAQHRHPTPDLSSLSGRISDIEEVLRQAMEDSKEGAPISSAPGPEEAENLDFIPSLETTPPAPPPTPTSEEKAAPVPAPEPSATDAFPAPPPLAEPK